MKIVKFHEKGAPEVLKVEEQDIPVPGEGQVLIKVDAAGVNYGDTLRRAGRHYPLPTPLPFAPGNEVMGVVEAVGSGVDAALIGSRVCASSKGSGYAQYAVAPVASCIPVPEDIEPATAIALMDVGFTAALVLKISGRIQAGDTVLVPAAAGGVGSLVVQLARLYGASKVIGLASTDEKRNLVLSLGADVVIDYTKDEWSKEVLAATDGVGVDLALEMTGGKVFHETLAALRQHHGRVAVYGNAADEAVSFNPRMLVGRCMSMAGLIVVYHEEKRAAVMEELFNFTREGKLKPLVGGVYSLADAPKAHAALEGRASTGKLVLAPWID